MSDVRRFMPQLVTGLPGQRTSPGVAMVEVTDGGLGWVDLSVHERALAAEARWSALEAVARGERDNARAQLAAKDAEIAELRKAVERAEADVQLLARERDSARQDLYFTKANLAQRDVAFAQQRADWAKAVTERDEARAEIAELRSRIDRLAAAKLDPPYVVLDESLSEGLKQKSMEVLQWQGSAGKAMRERDEARECVRRLCEILREIYVNTPISEELYEKALAATPEHLRR